MGNASLRGHRELEQMGPFLEALLNDLRLLRDGLNSPDAAAEEVVYLGPFQRHLTQAAVEKRAVSERAALLDTLFKRWVEFGRIRPE